MFLSPLNGSSWGGVKVLKTVGGGAAGSANAFLVGRNRMYKITKNSEKSMRFMGVAIDALLVRQSELTFHAGSTVCTCLHLGLGNNDF